jgi:hypothetical protein
MYPDPTNKIPQVMPQVMFRSDPILAIDISTRDIGGEDRTQQGLEKPEINV